MTTTDLLNMQARINTVLTAVELGRRYSLFVPKGARRAMVDAERRALGLTIPAVK